MKPNIRGWQLIAGLVVVAAAVVGLALYLTRSSKLDAVSMSAHFPSRNAVVLYIDVQAMRTSGVMEKLVGSTVGEEAEYKAFVEGTGFDYKRDLDGVMLNSAAGVHYFVLQGRFDWNKLKAYAKAQGGACDGDLCHLKGSTPDRVISFRPIGSNGMALASARDENGARAIDRRTPEKQPWDIPNAPVWAHVPSEAIKALPSYPSGTRLFAKAIESADRAIFTLGPAQDGFELKADVECRTEEDAAVLKAQLEGVTSLLQKLIAREGTKPSTSDLSGVLTAGAFERQKTHVVARWPVTRALIESLGKG